ncbi:hypothetical protein LDENG_00147460 [Lucifuga dentata]|nr:hypothetical protein LDENG_00147460 [Lucifuga dentata]
MSSRRMMARSYSGNGRPNHNNGDDTSGSSRAGGCSYLSNVRPENRSTLCSIMAQLTEETQPCFETTLKSKAVSKNCNVKFTCVVTGYPTPEVIWYKDDKQLDRYCGLPKYEIFRNGQSHSLYIYNCTVEDAAIYQVSAKNTKGIVSCSGVLEVGEMNEFKIHQRYFDKLKQKAEHRRRELEGKENQGPEDQDVLRTISPDRSQRKRRSTVEPFLSTPSSLEDEGNEENDQAMDVKQEDRLLVKTVGEVEEKSVPMTNGAVSPIANGQSINENGGNDLSRIYDSAHQPKTPSVKKKIRISSSATVVKAEPLGERVYEERGTNGATSTSAALSYTEPIQAERNLDEVMEVESVNLSVLDSDSGHVTEQCQISSTEKALHAHMLSKDEKVCVKEHVPSNKQQPAAPLPPAALQTTNHTVAGPAGKPSGKHEKKIGHKDTKENLDMQNKIPYSSSIQLQPVAQTSKQPLHTVKEDITKSEDLMVRDVDWKSSTQTQIVPLMLEAENVNLLETLNLQFSSTSTDGTIAHRDVVSVGTPCESKNTFPECPSELSGDQLSGKETSPCQKNASVSQPLQLSEVTQAHTKMNRNDSPVNPELPPDQCMIDAQPPQKTPSKRDTIIDDIQTPTSGSTVEAVVAKMTQDIWDHSRGSNESHTLLLTDLQKSPLKSSGDGENTPGCNVSPATQQSQVDASIKTVEGAEMQVDEKVEGNKVCRSLVQADSLASNENTVEMETETVCLHMTEKSKIDKTGTAAHKDTDVADVNVCKPKKKEPGLKMAEETHSDIQNLKPANLKIPHLSITKNPENKSIHNTNLAEQQIKGFKEIPSPVAKVISIAELLRSQIKALESTVAESLTTISVPDDFLQCSTTADEKTCPEQRGGNSKFKLELKNFDSNSSETSGYAAPTTSIKATLMEVFNQLNKTVQEQMQSLGTASPDVEVLQEPVMIPPISVIDIGNTIEATRFTGMVQKYDETVMDTGQESGAVGLIPLKDCPGTENAKISPMSSMTSKEELTNIPSTTPNLNQSGTVSQEPEFTDFQKYDENVMDTGQESGASGLIPLEECPGISSSSGTENVKISPMSPVSPKEKLRNTPPTASNSNQTVSQEFGTQLTDSVIEKDSSLSPPIKGSMQESIITTLENGNEDQIQSKDVGIIQNITPEIKLISKTHWEISAPDSTTLLDKCKMQDNPTADENAQSIQKISADIRISTETQGVNLQVIQPESSMAEEFSKTDSISDSNTEASPLLKKRTVSPIPSATPQELASGARRKILIPKAKTEEVTQASSLDDHQTQKKEVSAQSSKLSLSPVTLSVPPVSPSLSRRSPLLQSDGEVERPAERRSPLLSRRKMAPEIPATSQEIGIPKTEGKPAEKDKRDQFKAPQIIRKIRGESFSDASGHLKLWCQFFNVLSDSTIKWYRNEVEIAQLKRTAGDETPVNLAIVQASALDSGVYGCTITNEYGTDSTDFLLSAEILAGMFLREDLGVGEEIEMTPLMFSKGVADSGVWGNNFFGRIMMQESHIGDGCSHKVWRAKVIYGLEPVFESGNTCIIKACNPITYGGKEESQLIERNLNIAKQECRIQNLAREYCKIFSAETRVIENFGPSLEVVPVYLMYRPANTVPYATVEADLEGVYQKYSALDHTGRLVRRTGSEVELKCCTLQHWIFQWTNGNLLVTQLEGVDTKITNVGVCVKSSGYQGLSLAGNPKVFEQFVSQHQCNYYCGLLSLRSLKQMDSLMTPSKPKGSRSPLLQRKMATGSSSPQSGRKSTGSPRLPRKAEQDSSKSPEKQKVADTP